MVAAPIVPIGVMLGKADTAFRMVGGSSIIFNAIRSRIFGKILRAVEYPDGDLHSVKIYRMNLHRLKALIANTQPPPFPTAFLQPDDIKQITVFTSPHFTEPVQNDSDVSALPENAWLLWSKDDAEKDPIPSKGVKLDGSHIVKNVSRGPELLQSELVLQDRAMMMAGRIRKSKRISRWEYDRIIDLAVDRDSGLLAIARNFGEDAEEFQLHCCRMLRRRDPRGILVTDSIREESGVIIGDGDEGSVKRDLEPQVDTGFATTAVASK
eukprot:GFKZ01012687.1.p1 GENE.GFKZ01012687.1~~GFKZ01012687.1.p1  ORF type:complete len:267 (+),score=35.04 GFKZ01012687.1:265-1065(+)